MNHHCNDAVSHFAVDSIPYQSNTRYFDRIVCFMSGCLSEPIARCVLCSKHSCYLHLQTCIQHHSHEIEIVNRLELFNY